MRVRTLLLPAALAAPVVAALGCQSTTSIARVDPATMIDERTTFLNDGQTTRETVLLRLGEPTGTHEDGRLFTYVMRATDSSLVAASPRREGPSGLYHLVLAFDDAGVLREHSVVVGQ